MTGRRRDAIYCSRVLQTRASDARRVVDGRSRRRDRARYASEADHRRAYARLKGRELRDAARVHYGDRCVECGSKTNLELDHVHGNGEVHRDRVGHGDAFFRYLLNAGFPLECESDGEYALQVLCHRDHTAKTKCERRGRK